MLDISRRGGGAAEHIEADLSTEQGWNIAAQVFNAQVRGFDGERVVCVLNAGTIHPIGFAGRVDGDAYRRNVMLNGAAPQVLGDAFLRATQGLEARSDLVLIGSGAASKVYPGWSAYGAAKAATAHWVRTVGREQELLGSGTHVWWIAPGVVATSMQAEIRSTQPDDFPDVDRFRQLHDQGELADPYEVAHQLWRVIDEPYPNGSVLDLRNLEPARPE